MNQYEDHNIISNPSLRDRAKGVLAGGYRQPVLAFFLVWLITMAADLLISLFLSFVWSVIVLTRETLVQDMSAEMLTALLTDPASLSALLDHYQKWFNLLDHTVNIGVSVFTNIFHAGLSLLCLNLACSRPAGVSDLFYGFKYQFRKSLKLSFVYTLTEELYLFPFSIFIYLFYQGQDAPPAALLLSLCLTAAGLAAGGYCMLRIALCFFLMLDFPDYSTGELLRLSARLMNGHKKRLLLLHLSFVPLQILSVFTLGIANLWIVPYRALTKAFFFLNLMQARDHDG